MIKTGCSTIFKLDSDIYRPRAYVRDEEIFSEVSVRLFTGGDQGVGGGARVMEDLGCKGAWDG